MRIRTSVKACLAFLLSTLALIADCNAQAPHVPSDWRLRGLGSLYLAEDAENYRKLCSQRVPSTLALWDQAIVAFGSRNRTQLAELKAMQERILSAMNSDFPIGSDTDRDTRAAIANAWPERKQLEESSLASADAAHAASGCEHLREAYSQTSIDDKQMASAREATSAAIAGLGRH